MLTYALIEAQSPRLREVSVPVLAPGQEPLRVLHISDLHMTPRNHRRQAWVRSLAHLQPDLVVVTGDFLAHRDALGPVIGALDALLDIPGVFVLGSNDYYAPTFGNPLQYLSAPSERGGSNRPDLPWRDLVSTLVTCGWRDLSNRDELLHIDGRIVDARGVDDPHIKRDDYAQVAGPFRADADLRLAIAHAPYLRVIDAMAADHADLIMCGHTHGGQVCVPGYGALVTNCDLDNKAASGLSRCGDSWLHVSAGLGTSPFAPIRFACPPEATLLTLVTGPRT